MFLRFYSTTARHCRRSFFFSPRAVTGCRWELSLNSPVLSFVLPSFFHCPFIIFSFHFHCPSIVFSPPASTGCRWEISYFFLSFSSCPTHTAPLPSQVGGMQEMTFKITKLKVGDIWFTFPSGATIKPALKLGVVDTSTELNECFLRILCISVSQ